MEGSSVEVTPLEDQGKQSLSSEDHYLRIRQTRPPSVLPCPIMHNLLPFLTNLHQGMNIRLVRNHNLCTGPWTMAP